MTDIKDVLFLWFINLLIKNFASFVDKYPSSSAIKSRPNKQLEDELHKPIIKIFKRTKVYSSFKGNIHGADLADMQLTSKYNKGIRILLCVIDILSKYA